MDKAIRREIILIHEGTKAMATVASALFIVCALAFASKGEDFWFTLTLANYGLGIALWMIGTSLIVGYVFGPPSWHRYWRTPDA